MSGEKILDGLRDAVSNASLTRAEHERLTRSWHDDFVHENGRYMSGCCVCGNAFYGHKRRVVCKECSDRSVSAQGRE